MSPYSPTKLPGTLHTLSSNHLDATLILIPQRILKRRCICLLCCDCSAGEDHVKSSTEADDGLQPNSPTVDEGNTKSAAEDPENGVLLDNADVTYERKLQTSSNRIARHCAYDRLFDLHPRRTHGAFRTIKSIVARVDSRASILLCFLTLVVLGDFMEVETSAKGAVGTIQNADLLSVVVLKCLKGLGKFLGGCAVYGVLTVRARDGDGCDAIWSLSSLHGLRLFVSHCI
ncbi:hypothetical protein HG530_001747 [Fusarium avenaceum]|nr:hypothetical protein HG530_001747 [Fusarium avenaceum]